MFFLNWFGFLYSIQSISLNESNNQEDEICCICMESKSNLILGIPYLILFIYLYLYLFDRLFKKKHVHMVFVRNVY